MRQLNDYAGKLGITFDKNTSKHTDQAELALAKWHLTQQAVQLFIVNKLVPAFLDFTNWFEKKGLPALKQHGHVVHQAHPADAEGRRRAINEGRPAGAQECRRRRRRVREAQPAIWRRRQVQWCCSRVQPRS